jgi:hypothetical protein
MHCKDYPVTKSEQFTVHCPSEPISLLSLLCYENRTIHREGTHVNMSGLFMNLEHVSGVGLAILDEHLRFRTVNPTLARINGISIAGHLGKTVVSVLGSFESAVSPLIRHVMTIRKPLLHCTLVGLLPTRHEEGHWIAHYLPLRDSMVGAVVLEVTALRKVDNLLSAVTAEQAPEGDRTLEAVERDYVIHVLKKVKGQISGKNGAAIRLGLKRTTLQSRLLKLGVNPRDYNSAS